MWTAVLVSLFSVDTDNILFHSKLGFVMSGCLCSQGPKNPADFCLTSQFDICVPPFVRLLITLHYLQSIYCWRAFAVASPTLKFCAGRSVFTYNILTATDELAFQLVCIGKCIGIDEYTRHSLYVTQLTLAPQQITSWHLGKTKSDPGISSREKMAWQ